MVLARRASTMVALRRLALPLVLTALFAGSAFGASATQTRGKSNRAAILKSRADRGEKGRVRTQFVRDAGKSSLVKVMKLDAKGKPTGKVEAYLVNKETGVARPTDVSSLHLSKTVSKKAPSQKAPSQKAPSKKAPSKAAKRTIPRRTVRERTVTRVASVSASSAAAAAAESVPE